MEKKRRVDVVGRGRGSVPALAEAAIPGAARQVLKAAPGERDGEGEQADEQTEEDGAGDHARSLAKRAVLSKPRIDGP